VPRMRHIALAAAVLTSGGMAAGAALAADQNVAARDFEFTPQVVAVKPGDTVTITNEDDPVAHDLQFEDESFKRATPSSKWTVQRTFGAADQRDAPYTYFCSLHAGMNGSVYVNATGTVPAASPTATASATPAGTATATPTRTATATATPTGSVGSGGTSGSGGTGGTGGPTATLRSASIAARACMRRSARCRRPGARLRIDLSAPADVRGTLRRRAPGARRFRAFGAVRFGRVAAGPRTLTFTRTAAGRRLRPGRYALALRAAGEKRSLRFRVL
jgi:plastocyanin